MRRLCFIIFVVFISYSFFSCSGKIGNYDFVSGDPQSLIVGRWNLQKENYTQYVNGVKQTDTTVATSNYFVSYAQFNKSGSYYSVSRAFANYGTGVSASQDSIAGTYSVSSTSFNLSSPYFGGGFTSGSPVFGGTVTEIPVITLVSQLAQIKQLTANLLTIHTEIVTNSTYQSTGVTTNYKAVADMYYSK